MDENSVNFIAGGVAGAVSRTVVSPFERIKILLQVQKKSANTGIYTAIRDIYVREGWKGWFRGNGLNCLRIFPYSAIQFIVYNRTLPHCKFQDETLNRLISGSCCGFASVIATYPMDLVRTRLSIQTANIDSMKLGKARDLARPPGFIELLRKIYKSEGGLKALYRGVFPTCYGVVPYVALNFTIYEQLKDFVPSSDPYWKDNFTKLGIGAVSGGIAQTTIYPFDLLRRRFQVVNMGNSELGFKYSSVSNALITIVKQEGWRGCYNGLTVNLFKVVPSTAVSWVVYEMCKDLLQSKDKPSGSL